MSTVPTLKIQNFKLFFFCTIISRVLTSEEDVDRIMKDDFGNDQVQ